MRRTVIGVFTLLLLTLLAPYRADALGLGDIMLSSYLNQPLKARIGLLPAQADEVDSAKISLAPNDAFERAGIERRSVLDLLNFKVVKGADGRPFIQVTSQEPIKEPFLDFILQVTWPKGRLLREYTVLLDPPVTTAESAPPIQPAVSGTATAPAEASTQSAPPEASTQSAPPETATAQEAAAPEAGAAPTGIPTRSIEPKLTHDVYGPTQRGDTLWSIATRVRPDHKVSIQQVMVAIVKENPDAFYRDNVNTLKAGYILRLPDLALINQVSHADAFHAVKRQNQQWQDMKAGKIPTTGPAPAKTTKTTATTKTTKKAPANQAGTGANAASAAPATTGEEARLKLLPPDAGQTAAGGTGGTTAAGKSTQDHLASSSEANEAQQQENASMRAKIDELNGQVQSMQRLLALKDDTLAVLQNKLSQTQQGAVESQAAVHQGTAATASQPPEAQAQTPQVQPPQAQQAPAPKPKSAGPPPPTVVKPPVHAIPKPPQSGGLLSDPEVLGIGGVVVVVAAALGWLAMRRRKMRAEALMPGEASQAPQASAEAAGSDEETVETEVYSPTGGDLLEAEVNEIDPLAEADVYMAYRRYQQAEELLKGAIDQEPNRQELRLKLLEVYAAAENADAFAAQAETFYNQYGGRDNPLWEKVAAMGREVSPSHPLFSGGGGDAIGEVALADAGVPAGGDLSDFSMDIESLAMGDGGETASNGDESLHVDVQQADEPVAGIEDVAWGSAESETEAKDESPVLEFESGLDKLLPEQSPAAESEDKVRSFKADNEIDFDTMAAGGDQSDTNEQPVEASGDGSLDDGFEGGLLFDTVDGLNDVEHTDDAAGQVFMEENEGQDGSGEVAGDGAEELSGLAEGDQDHGGQDHGKLDFDFDLGSLATKDKDTEDFFEGLDGSEEGYDGSDDGHEEVGTKLDLAKAFIEMGDQDGAKDILKEVVDHGDDDQKQQAHGLLQQLEA